MSTAAAKKKFVQPLRKFALAFPGAWEDHPWGENVAKVGKKVFAFFGHDDYPQYGMSVKLPQSRHEALSFSCSEPTGYGLGKSGWVTIRLDKGNPPPLDALLGWIEESYRAVAPKTLAAKIPAGGMTLGAAKAPKQKAAKKKTAKKTKKAKKAKKK